MTALPTPSEWLSRFHQGTGGDTATPATPFLPNGPQAVPATAAAVVAVAGVAVSPALATENCAARSLSPASPDPERTAIMEADGGLCRYWAERLAALHPDRPPSGVSPRRWGEALDAALQLVEQWGPQLAAFNWSELDLFGALPAAPAHAIDCQGAAWLLRASHRVIAVTPDALTLRTPSGAVQRIRRRPLTGAAPLWELTAE